MILTFTSSGNRSRTLVFYRVCTDLSFLSGKRTSIRAHPLDPREIAFILLMRGGGEGGVGGGKVVGWCDGAGLTSSAGASY